MGQLRNVFSWSFSAAQDFEECPRRRYWSKYGMWGGWGKEASAIQRKAYQLNKMTNLYALQGVATEMAALWLLKEARAGHEPTADQAYETVARPFLNRSWKESRDGDWRMDPKRYCCLREHYYKVWQDGQDKHRTEALVAHTRLCLAFFADRTLPRIKDVDPAREIQIAAGGQGDPESFELDGVKIYAIPDYAYREGFAIHIHDWKAGRAKPDHRRQLAVYALWAMRRHAARPDQVFGYIEYLSTGQVAPVQFDDEVIDETLDWIDSSVGDMSAYLLNGDREQNVPVPCEEWDLAPDPASCRLCNFYELCRNELEAT